jgi:uroporphyrin-3 C-methyltransferase/uroporphyrinogen III methyltransferase/synthase
MNDLSSTSESQASADPHMNPPPQQNESIARGASSPAGKAPHESRRSRVIYIAIAVLALLLAAQWWSSHTQISGLREEVAQRLKNSDSSDAETRVLVKSMQEGMKELQGKVSILEGKQSEAQSQQLALEQLYQDLSKNRDDWALAEIEQVLSTASQQLQLAGNVQGALIALQNADSRLARSDKPQFLTIRRAIAKDLDRLRSLPTVDLTGMALRLDSIVGQVDAMPLLSDEKPVQPATPPKAPRRAQKAPGNAVNNAPAAKPNAANEWLAAVGEKWTSLTNEMWQEVRQLVRIRNVETPDALLLSPTQAYYARENLKLRLLNARLALLSRNETAFRSDLTAAQDTIARYFDTRVRQTQAVQAQLRQVQASNLSIEMPNLAESLNAVRNYKAKP